jgi:rhodanese-related sulfurtransferase
MRPLVKCLFVFVLMVGIADVQYASVASARLRSQWSESQYHLAVAGGSTEMRTRLIGTTHSLPRGGTDSLTTPIVVDDTKVDLITVDELKNKVSAKEQVLILDVRSSESYANSRLKIKGALHFNVRKLKFRLGFPPLKDVPKDRVVVTYCACPSEEASIAAAKVLLDNGFKNVKALKGGWIEWQKANGPVEPRAAN